MLLIEAEQGPGAEVLREQRWLASSGAAVTSCRGAEVGRRLLASEADRFDVIVVDLDCPLARQSLSELLLAEPACACVCLATEALRPVLRDIQAAGAGFVSKGAVFADFMFAMRRAAELPLPDLRALAARARRLWQLPPQQSRLLYYNLWGYSNQEIADVLELSLHTVHEYQSELRRRSGARTKSDYLRLLQEHAGRHPEPHAPSS